MMSCAKVVSNNTYTCNTLLVYLHSSGSVKSTVHICQCHYTTALLTHTHTHKINKGRNAKYYKNIFSQLMRLTNFFAFKTNFIKHAYFLAVEAAGKFSINAVNCNSVLGVTRPSCFVCVCFVIPLLTLFFASSVLFSFLCLK